MVSISKPISYEWSVSYTLYNGIRFIEISMWNFLSFNILLQTCLEFVKNLWVRREARASWEPKILRLRRYRAYREFYPTHVVERWQTWLLFVKCLWAKGEPRASWEPKILRLKRHGTYGEFCLIHVVERWLNYEWSISRMCRV